MCHFFLFYTNYPPLVIVDNLHLANDSDSVVTIHADEKLIKQIATSQSTTESMEILLHHTSTNKGYFLCLYSNYHKGYRGDTTIGDIARAALFSSSFPDIKPPEQLTFEVMAKNLISEEVKEEDLDELDPKEFKSEDSDEDEGDVYEVADKLGILGNVQEDKMQVQLGETTPLQKKKL